MNCLVICDHELFRSQTIRDHRSQTIRDHRSQTIIIINIIKLGFLKIVTKAASSSQTSIYTMQK